MVSIAESPCASGSWREVNGCGMLGNFGSTAAASVCITNDAVGRSASNRCDAPTRALSNSRVNCAIGGHSSAGYVARALDSTRSMRGKQATVSTSTPRNDRAASPSRAAAWAACSAVAPTMTSPTRSIGVPAWTPSSARYFKRKYAPVMAASSAPVIKRISCPAASTSAGDVSAGTQMSQRRTVLAARGSQRETAAGPAGGTCRPSARSNSMVTSSRSKRTSAVGPAMRATASANCVVHNPAITGRLPTRTVVTAPSVGPSVVRAA